MCTGGLVFRRVPAACAAAGKAAFAAPVDKHASATAGTPLFSGSDLAAAHAAVEAAATSNTEAFATVSAAAPSTGVAVIEQHPEALPHSEPVNRFSSKIVPPMSLSQLSDVMQRTTKCGDEMAMVAVALTLRYCDTTRTPLTLKMMHRLFVAALHVAIKTHSDRYFRNDAYAMLAGVSVAELNLLEAEVLRGLDWRCLVDAQDIAGLVADPVGAVAASVPRAHEAQLATPVPSESSQQACSASDFEGYSEGPSSPETHRSPNRT
mmetsp:Transcript_46175/g.142365  ORF Transcript_46175/g.142365 Transcript_46175/m.142365 type:complete len:264 (-) Transcript_46175:446-1237(-)|eukprot:CAMPEP_0174855092 /NCGR_PEP_ID=MMETSP1114-20130205/32455_1 /TAXON_ID=312471 /ORGANISM="Neobodo designis, Strain CCAP 1951/1" /LENGTH=263 /DNA_ID=CAMNT_0016089815 /DNA_START=49 /DNA_END=840 /DNA_ORIENTATION=+